MDAAICVIAAIICNVFKSRQSAIIALDIVITTLAIEIAMLSSFWGNCAVAFFLLYAYKEAAIAAVFIGKPVRFVYCLSGIINLLCAVEVSQAYEFYFYSIYDQTMIVVFVLKLASMVDLRQIQFRGIGHVC